MKRTLEVLRILIVHQVREITTIIKDHIQSLSIGESGDSLVDTPRVLLFGLTLPREDRYTSCSNTKHTVFVSTSRNNISHQRDQNMAATIVEA